MFDACGAPSSPAVVWVAAVYPNRCLSAPLSFPEAAGYKL